MCRTWLLKGVNGPSYRGTGMGGGPEEKGKGSPWWGDREKGVRSKAVWAGFGCQTGLPGSRPISGREPEKK